MKAKELSCSRVEVLPNALCHWCPSVASWIHFFGRALSHFSSVYISMYSTPLLLTFLIILLFPFLFLTSLLLYPLTPNWDR